MKKSLLVGFIFLLCAFSAGNLSFAQTALDRVRVSYSSAGMTSIDLFIAREKKFFQQQNLDPQLVQMRASVAINAGISGELDVLGSIGSAIRAIQRGAPLRVVSVTLRRPMFWLVARPEYGSIKELKGTVLGVVTIGGSQHTMAKRMLTLAGLNPDKDLTTMQIGEESLQLQALATGAIQVAAISPPYVLIARDKFKMNVLDSSIDKFASIQNGAAVNLKTLQERPDFIRRFLRARLRANQYFQENEKEISEILARLWNSDQKTAVESYRISKPAFTTNGIPTDEEIKDYLALDAQILKLPEPVAPSTVFDFSLQREINREMGIK